MPKIHENSRIKDRPLKPSKNVYFSKDDFWSNGDHWMTSASRDLYDAFYEAIGSTFENNINTSGCVDIVEKILYMREFFLNHRRNITSLRENKSLKELEQLALNYVTGSKKLIHPVVPDKDNTVYLNFHDFFKNANHGWVKSGEGWETCKDFWDKMIVKLDRELLNNLYEKELEYLKAEFELDKKDSIDYLSSDTTRSYYQWLMYEDKSL